MLHFIKLTRPINLLVIALTMYVMHGLFLRCTWGGIIVTTVAPDEYIGFIFSDVYFALLVFSTLLIAAAGNIINDYFDVKIDRINKPEKLIVDRFIKKRKAILFHTILNFIAVVVALFIWYKTGSYWAIIFHFATTSALWMYSGVLKRKFLSGNVTIGILTALVPLLVYLYDKDTGGYYKTEHEMAFYTMGYFAVFAFFTTLIREIQKDFADMKGDSFYNCKTVPLYLGIKKGRIILFSIFAITIGVFIALFVMLAKFNEINIAFFACVGVFMAVSLFQSFKAIKRKDWINAATSMKLVMIVALIFFALKIYVG